MASICMASAPVSGARLTVSGRTRATVVCQAVQPKHDSLNRRAAVLGMAAVPLLMFAPKALALIPDEEDEELVEKAKANRSKRLAQQKGVTRDFLLSEDLKDVKLNGELVPVQKAVYQLAKSGSQLEVGDLKGVANNLSESWVEDFKKAAGSVPGAAPSDAVVAGLESFKKAAEAGDLKGSKQKFVSLVSDVADWALASGVGTIIKGL